VIITSLVMVLFKGCFVGEFCFVGRVLPATQ